MRWAAQFVGTAVMSKRGRELCLVRSLGGGVYEHKGRKHMLYNGNGFGESGFGWAVLEEDR